MTHLGRRSVLGLLLTLGLLAPGIAPGAVDIPFVRVVIDPNNPNTPDCKAVGDIDGDGFPDVLIASSADEGIYWYAYPAWTKHAIRTTGTFTTDMQVADVDGDGDLDLVVPEWNVGIFWYENPRPNASPATGFWIAHFIGAGNAHDVEVGDINNDGRIDVVTRPHGGGATNVWIQSTPTSWIQVVAGTDPGEGVALGDVDGDGDLDIANNGFWLENPLPGGNLFGGWPRHEIDPSSPADVGALIVDLNGDGRADVVLAPSESSGRFSWYEAADPKAGPWVEHVIDPLVSYFHTFKAADMDGDGDLDLVTAEMHQSDDPDEVSVYRNEGGALAWSQQVVATTGSHNLRIADIDSDGDIDIVGANWSESAADGAVVTLWRSERQATLPPFDQDGKADIAVYRPSTGQWFIWRSAGGLSIVAWGGPGLGDRPLSADFDADGQGDLAVYRPPTGEWFVLASTAGVIAVGWGNGAVGDGPVAADYDGDGLADIAVFRQTTGEWFVLRSADGGLTYVAWGAPGDVPVPADYDGDGRADVAVFRPTTGEWFVLRSADGGLTHLGWGAFGDVPVSADYDGDGRADVAVFRLGTGEWFVLRSADGGLTHLGWGAPALGDGPVPADYDGDDRTDIAVYRRSTGEWFILGSTAGLIAFAWGDPAGDQPVPLK